MNSDLLRSWNDGAAKSAILDFVGRVTKEGGSDYVRPAERIATFDNDGTLWCEQPLQVQFFFGHDRLQALAEKDPTIKERQPFKAFLEHDMKTIHDLGKKGFFEVAAATHAGLTEEEFDRVARAWLASTKHPKLGRLFTQLTYRPQVELLGFLRVKTHFEGRGEHAFLLKLADLNSFDDREVKPQNIGLHIGRRPILAFGNSDGDLARLRYAKSGAGSRLALFLHHDDAEREFACDREFRLSPLAEALDRAGDYGITVVSMKRDWKRVFDA